jgi:hypothetical protein
MIEIKYEEKPKNVQNIFEKMMMSIRNNKMEEVLESYYQLKENNYSLKLKEIQTPNESFNNLDNLNLLNIYSRNSEIKPNEVVKVQNLNKTNPNLKLKKFDENNITNLVNRLNNLNREKELQSRKNNANININFNISSENFDKNIYEKNSPHSTRNADRKKLQEIYTESKINIKNLTDDKSPITSPIICKNKNLCNSHNPKNLLHSEIKVELKLFAPKFD